ncbi:hypothetical protein AVEN_80830-1 [Araneus ventricosus]|uniref:Uncharacterized protein n=1 Tax=Araneus ventricosus TaxID=182803 RepID=A0A4Y2NUV0_ARAVE|nr:hypothetical protein AVEN_80830-1 [Araneus ventricosus]
MSPSQIPTCVLAPPTIDQTAPSTPPQQEVTPPGPLTIYIDHLGDFLNQDPTEEQCSVRQWIWLSSKFNRCHSSHRLPLQNNLLESLRLESPERKLMRKTPSLVNHSSKEIEREQFGRSVMGPHQLEIPGWK